eukprot:9452821-Karenia_brevis.AAC.1
MSAPPAESTTWKIWHLLNEIDGRSPLKMAALVEGVKLMMDSPWAIATTEQQHAAAAIFRRFHKEYGTEMLRLRAFVHSLRKLLPAFDNSDRMRAKTMRKLKALQAKVPSRHGARGEYLKGLFGVLRDWKQHNIGRPVSGRVQRTIVKGH